jgi:branched-chain amino acid transport system permease protein
MTVIGGMGTLEGPALGALLMIGLRQAMAEYPHLELFILGGLSILIMRWFPGGIMGALEPGFASRRTQEEKGA